MKIIVATLKREREKTDQWPSSSSSEHAHWVWRGNMPALNE